MSTSNNDAGNVDHEATVVMQDAPDRQGARRDEGVAALEKALVEAEAKAGEHRAEYLRALAELENVRKRAQRDVENAHRYGLERFAQELLAVKDSLEMGLEAGQKAVEQQQGGETADAVALLAGKQATLRLLTRSFEKFNITEIKPLGDVFDPQLHEAIAMQPSTTAEPNSVLQVIQKGYRLDDRLLRPARVIVAQAPPSGADA
jgi:molecular chaperone GrpE